MKVFRFKRFEVRNELAAQKVGTDAVLLGAALTLPDTTPQTAGDVQHLLDIGTGTGVIALMVAQRLADRIKSQGMSAEAPGKPSGTQPPFKILAIDIDPAAASEATANFAASPWAPSLQAEAISLEDLAQREGLLDAIFSNPPFFHDSLKAPDARRSAARHTDTLSYREICAFASAHLAPDGILSLILPAEDETPLLRYAASFGLKAFRILRIRTGARKAPKRIIAEFRCALNKMDDDCRCEELVLMDGPQRSAAYSELTADFYL